MLTIQRSFLNAARRNLVARSYHEKVVNYFENPPNVGSLKRKNQNVGTGRILLKQVL